VSPGRSPLGRHAVWLLTFATGVLLILHATGWVAAAVIFWRKATIHAPRLQSAIVIVLSMIILDSCASDRGTRRRVTVAALVLAAIAFVVVPLPKAFEDHGLSGGPSTAASRQQFEARFSLAQGVVHFHSHLGDVLMGSLDKAFGRSAESPGRAYDTMSRLAGLLFLVELVVAGSWHRWSREVCRYIALVLATPVCLLYFGYWELGYLSVTAGVVPLLALARNRGGVHEQAATLTAGFEQGLHTAGHGFGLTGLAGGALAALCTRGTALRRLLASLTFASSGVALYLGWIFIYLTVAGLQVVWSRQLGYRPFFEPMVFDRRIANPLFSLEGLGEFGLFSALSGVPLFALAMATTGGARLLPAILYSVPALIFLIRWWPVSAPYNLDLLLAVFPGQFAALWVLSSSRMKSRAALVIIVGLHVLLWTTLGSAMFDRVWIEAGQ